MGTVSDMASYPFLVQCAWNALGAVFHEWQKEPYRWSGERDVQLEIASRLNTLYKLIGKDSVVGELNWVESGFNPRQNWARVACDPYMAYTYSDGKKYRCHPDIVVWNDLPDSQQPDHLPGKSYPVLWACELKYAVRNPGTWDLEKLRYLVNQNQVQYACWVKISRCRATRGVGVDWFSSGEGRRLWQCEVSLPPLLPDAT